MREEVEEIIQNFDLDVEVDYADVADKVITNHSAVITDRLDHGLIANHAVRTSEFITAVDSKAQFAANQVANEAIGEIKHLIEAAVVAGTGAGAGLVGYLNRYLSANNAIKPVLILGEQGAGKTFACRSIKDEYDLFVEVGCHSGMESRDFIGGFFPDGKGGLIWTDAGVAEAYRAAGDGEPAGETGPVPPEHTHNYGDMTGAEFAVVKPREYAQGLKLATILARAFRTNGGDKVNSAAPSKRLSLRNIAAGKMEKPYRRVEKVEKGIPTVSVIMDGSRSMKFSGADSHARVMLYALNKLACDGVIKCNATLTVAFGVGGQCQMPCAPAKMAWRSISGSEGFSKTFTKKMSEFAKSDIVIALTDGCLGEDKPDFRALHSRGVYVVGAYSTPHAGDPKYLAAYASVLRAHFDRFVIRKTPEDTADAVARLIASRR